MTRAGRETARYRDSRKGLSTCRSAQSEGSCESDRRSSPGTAADGKGSAQLRCASFHVQEPSSPSPVLRQSDAVITDLEHDPLLLKDKTDLDRRGAGMLHDVDQRLLVDAEQVHGHHAARAASILGQMWSGRSGCHGVR